MRFVCPDPAASVRGANVRATLDAFHLLPTVGLGLLARHSLRLDELTDDRFVPLQRWLDVLREVEAEVGSSVMRRVGSHVIENADFPPVYPDVDSILLGLDDIYHLNHRGEVGHYRADRAEDGTITIRCGTPYPPEFERGLVEGICRSNRSGGHRYSVEYTEHPMESDLTCTLLVRK